jgi:hypothetical protein
LAISATNTFKGVQLAEGKPGINAEQLMAAVIDELSRRVNARSTLLADYKSCTRITGLQLRVMN